MAQQKLRREVGPNVRRLIRMGVDQVNKAGEKAAIGKSPLLAYSVCEWQGWVRIGQT